MVMSQLLLWRLGPVQNVGIPLEDLQEKQRVILEANQEKQQIDEMLESGVAFEIAGFATQLKVGEENLTKILNVMINKGSIKGKIKDGIYEP